MFEFITKFFDPSRKILKEAETKVPLIKKFIDKYKDKNKEELKRIIDKHKKTLSQINERIPDELRDTIKLRRKDENLHVAEIELYEKIQEIMPEIYAILTLITQKKVGFMLHDVQLLAACVLSTGQKLVEVKTGEGKTNIFHLPLFLYGLTNRGAHLVTVNDYLARRDGEYAGHIFSELGLKVGIITPQQSYIFQKQDKNLGKNQIIQLSDMKGENLKKSTKKQAYECDIVYGTNNEFGFDYLRDNMIQDLDKRAQRELYFCIVDEADSILIDEARTPLIISAPAEKSNELYRKFARLVPNLKKEKHYVVEEKERSVNLTDEGMNKIEKLIGVDNIWKNYQLAHHLENALKANVFYKKDDEYIVKNQKVMIVDEFTGRVLEGRRYSEGLHQAIEAKENVPIQQESRTLATITFQNFFRLYKILGGGSGTIMTEQEEFYKIYNLESAAIPTNKPIVRKDVSDKVYKNQQAKFEAVAEEIINSHKTGQPILVGTTSIADSELISDMLSKKKIKHEVLNAKFHEREAQIVAKAGQKNSITVATNMAGRGTDIPLGKDVKEVGGLYVLGTERHESRRIDNQLRGRSGRQGDPGKSCFFVSLEDKIMKIQGGDIVKRIMDMTNLPEDIPLESKMITGSIERAQKRMEGMYFDSRKRVVEYDDVVNQQREIFYTRRFRFLKLSNKFQKFENKLHKKDISEIEKQKIQNKKTQLITELLKEFKDVISIQATELSDKYFEDQNNLQATFKNSSKEKSQEKNSKNKNHKTILIKSIINLGQDQYFIKAANKLKLFKKEIQSVEKLKKVLINHLDKINNSHEELYEFINNFLNHAVDIRLNDINYHSNLIKSVFLQTMDELWTLHLDYMQDVREGIGLRGVAQLDPLVEYKNEGFKAFANFIEKVNHQAFLGLMQTQKESENQNSESSKIVLNIDPDSIKTNIDQISDINEGDREILDSLLQNIQDSNSSQTQNSKAQSNNKQNKLSRRQRRALKRAKAKKKK